MSSIAAPGQLTLVTRRVQRLYSKKVDMGWLQRRNAIGLLSSCAKAAVRWGDGENAYWSARFAARLARPLLVEEEDFFVNGWWMEGGEA